MTHVSKYGACPVCGQSLVDETMRRRVEGATAASERSVRAKVRRAVEAEVSERLEAKYAAENARAKVRADQLQRQLDTRSAHDRGIKQEQDLLEALRTAFPRDRIERQGRGGDILHTVVHGDSDVGLILYESKNAGVWQNAWLAKLRQDGRKRHTPYLILVSRKLPAQESGLCVRRDVAVCEPPLVTHVAAIMRQWVIATYRADTLGQDQPDKPARIYRYLQSREFRADFEEILACSTELDAQLAAERNSHERVWDQRSRIHQRLRMARLTIGAKLDGNASEQVDNSRKTAAPPEPLPINGAAAR